MHLIGLVSVSGAIGRIDIDHAAQLHSVTDANDVIALNVSVAWIGGVDEVEGAVFGATMGFFANDEVNAVAVFEP